MVVTPTVQTTRRNRKIKLKIISVSFSSEMKSPKEMQIIAKTASIKIGITIQKMLVVMGLHLEKTSFPLV